MGSMYHISIIFSLTLRQPLLYHQLYMIDSCILEHRSHYSFDTVMSMGMPASSIYISHIICISRARLQLHHRTVEICRGHWSIHYLVEDPGCHLTLAHWWVYLWDPYSLMSLVIFGLHWWQCLGSPSVIHPYLQYLMLYIVPRRFWLSVLESLNLCTLLDPTEH